VGCQAKSSPIDTHGRWMVVGEADDRIVND
jgi:hypothetical protein